MFPLLDDAISPEISVNDNVTYMASISLFHGANLDAEQSESVKHTIRSLIDSPETRFNGLLLFEAALQQITPFYVDHWPNIITANLSGVSVLCKEVTFRILKLVLRKIQYGSYKTTAKFMVPAFVRILISEENMNCLAAVQCLSLCIKTAPERLLDLKNDYLQTHIETFLLKQMDTPSSKMCEAVSECFIAFLYVEEIISGKKATFAETYSHFQKKILNTLQEIVNRLLCSSEEFPIGNDDAKDKFELPDTLTVQLSTFMTLARIFSTLAVCASKMLSSEIVERKEVNVPALWILEFMNRVFEMTHISQNKESSVNNELVLIIYPIIHKSTFIILESLIQHFDLVEQVENIIRLIRKSIEASYITTFSDKSNSQMRFATWKVLNIWLNSYGLPVSLIVGNKKYLILELLKDITTEISDDQLLVNSQTQPSHKKKAPEIFFPLPAEKSSYSKSKMRTCNEALKVLRILIYTASPFLEEKLKEEITSTVISTSKKVQKHNRFKVYPFPYMDEKCRRNLYELSLAFLISSNSFKIQILTQSVAILKMALRDQSLKIKEFSNRATSMSRLVLHSRKKVPDAFTHKKTLFEPSADDNLCHGWETASTWNMNNSDSTNNSASNISHKPNKHTSLPNEIHKNENEKPNTFSNKEYNSSEFDSTSYTKEEIQCNGDGITEIHASSQSESEMEDQSEQEPPTKQLITTGHSSKLVDKDITSDPDVSSEEDNLSIAEEENEDSKVEDDVNSVTCNEAIVQGDQNGLCTTTSEEEIPNSSKGENGGYSYSEDGSYEEEEETKDFGDNKHESELSDNEPPFKKQKTLEINETIEEMDDSRTEEVKDTTSETEIARESSGEDGEPVPGSPTVEDMCKTFVLCEPTSEISES